MEPLFAPSGELHVFLDAKLTSSGVFERVLKDVDLLSYQPTVKVPSKLADMAPFLRFLEAGGPKGYPLTETANTLHARPLLSIVAMCEAYAVRPFVRDMLTHHVDTHAALLVNSPRARADRVLLARLAHAARSPQLWRALLDLNQNAHHAHPSASSDTLVTDVEKEGEEKDGGDTHSHQTRRHKKPWWPSTQEAQALGTVPYCAILFVANESALGHDVRDLGIKYIGGRCSCLLVRDQLTVLQTNCSSSVPSKKTVSFTLVNATVATRVDCMYIDITVCVDVMG